LRVLAQTKLFAMAAPSGGLMMIGGWVVIAVSAILRPAK
jgi:uncharacterized membrane protein YgdD (TMEM256/DUF423 family)